MAAGHEPDAVPRGPVVVSALIVVVVSAAFVAAAWAIDAGRRHGLAPVMVERTWPQQVQEVNQMDLTQFYAPTAAERRAGAEAARVRSYGWVDRERGVIHVPLERAIELYLREEATP